MGFRTSASGLQSVALNGGSATSTAATADYSLAHGFQGTAYLRSQRTLGNSNSSLTPFSSNAQSSELVSHRSSTLATSATTILSLDGTGTTNLIIPSGNNRAWNATIETVATVTTISGTATGVSVGNSFLQNDTVLFKRVGGTSSVVGSSNNLLISDDALSTASMNYSSGASQELALTFQAPTFAGGGTVTFRVVSKVSLVEVAY